MAKKTMQARIGLRSNTRNLIFLIPRFVFEHDQSNLRQWINDFPTMKSKSRKNSIILDGKNISDKLIISEKVGADPPMDKKKLLKLEKERLRAEKKYQEKIKKGNSSITIFTWSRVLVFPVVQTVRSWGPGLFWVPDFL